MSLRTFITILEYTGTVVGTLVVIGGAAALVYGVFRQARHKEVSDGVQSDNQLITYYKDQIDGFKEMLRAQDIAHQEKMKTMEANIQKLATEISNLNIKITEKDKQIQLFKDLMSGRDDATVQFRDLMIQASKDQAQYRAKTTPIFEELLAYMKNSNTKFEELKNTAPTEMKINGTLTTNK